MDPTSLTDPHARTLFNLYDRAVRQYFPQPYPGRLVLLRCPLGSARAALGSPYPDYGWQPLAAEVETLGIPTNGHLVTRRTIDFLTVSAAIRGSCLRCRSVAR